MPFGVMGDVLQRDDSHATETQILMGRAGRRSREMMNMLGSGSRKGLSWPLREE
jgi:hypothetical protein